MSLTEKLVVEFILIVVLEAPEICPAEEMVLIVQVEPAKDWPVPLQTSVFKAPSELMGVPSEEKEAAVSTLPTDVPLLFWK